MTYVNQKGVWVPKNMYASIKFFIDEIYFAKKSGFMQAILFAPERTYEKQIIPECKKLLSSIGPNCKEFKGKNISKKNMKAYINFLALFVDVSVIFSDQYKMRPLVSIDSYDFYSDQMHKNILHEIKKAFNKSSNTHHEKVFSDFVTQIIWLVHHFKDLTQTTFINGFEFIFDNKFSYAKDIKKFKMFKDMSGRQVVLEIRRILKIFAQSILEKFGVKNVQGWSYQDSSECFGLQAADLLVHLVYSCLKFEKGLKERTAEAKREVLRTFLPNFLANLNVSEDFDLIDAQIVLKKKNYVSKICFEKGD